MVLIYESDPLDNEDARGRFYHVCRGRIDRTEIQLPADEKVYRQARPEGRRDARWRGRLLRLGQADAGRALAQRGLSAARARPQCEAEARYRHRRAVEMGRCRLRRE